MKVFFLDPENGFEHSKEMTAEEFRTIVEMKPVIYVDGDNYVTYGEVQYNVQDGDFQLIIFKKE